MNVKSLIAERIELAIYSVTGQHSSADIQLSTKSEHGDYQANGIMRIAKALKIKPRELAEQVIAQTEYGDIVESLVVAGPGFINIELKNSFFSELLEKGNLIKKREKTKTVVIDYSSPNLAKEMHVGHLRSTIIGDAIARILDCLGYNVIRQNHVGDWGTQFGMLIENMEHENFSSENLADLETFYRSSKKKFDEDPEFAQQARARVVSLQSGDQLTRNQWLRFINISLSHCREIYERLGVSLSDEDLAPESSYNALLPTVIEALNKRGLLEESEGAQCVFLEEFTSSEGDRQPLIVRKSDGGYLYATTDLAAILHRENLGADRIIYITDARQKLHFKQVFAVAKQAGFAKKIEQMNHFSTGAMLASNGRPFKTREGGTIRLSDLLNEAEQRALNLLKSKGSELTETEQNDLAKAIGIGAVKYADLSKNRNSDYIFDWDNMLALNGNTAPYMQYAYARIQSIFRQAEVQPDSLSGKINPVAQSERALCKELIRFQEVLDQVAAEGFPHYLCVYLYNLSSLFSKFYEELTILDADKEKQASRLLICERTGSVLKLGLSLLGITVLERM
ncbi:MAG: arginine--tRNA ligase [Gammaproteobacteria bacterium]|nr:arginine--tRNA ligase [Gammaproteobacteria bacterium]